MQQLQMHGFDDVSGGDTRFDFAQGDRRVVEAAAQDQRRDVGGTDASVREDLRPRQPLAPANDFRNLALLQPEGEASRDELESPLRVVRQESVLQGFLVELMLGEPAAGALVQDRDARCIATQNAAQEIQEQRVIAIPVAVTVERLDEQLRALEAFEQRLAVRDPEQGVAQLARHPVDDAARDQEFADLLALLVQHRSAEVARDFGVRACELLQRLGRGGAGRGRQERQLGAGNPTFRARLDAGGFFTRQRAAAQFAAQLHDQAVVEVQVLRRRRSAADRPGAAGSGRAPACRDRR